jgi:hypothetical protein
MNEAEERVKQLTLRLNQQCSGEKFTTVMDAAISLIVVGVSMRPDVAPAVIEGLQDAIAQIEQESVRH